MARRLVRTESLCDASSVLVGFVCRLCFARFRVPEPLAVFMPAPLHPDHIPLATCRLQLRPDFTLDDAANLVPYLDQLGIGDVYLSPMFRARTGSTHGYDVVDHRQIEPSFGGEAALSRLSDALRQRGMGLLIDIVPNHMGIDDPANFWWQDVLRHGEGSRYARNFDIDWDPPVEKMRHKVLLPILGDYFGRVLESGELRLTYDDGCFMLTVYGKPLPIAPATWPPVLRLITEKVAHRLDEDDPERLELESLTTALDRLPPPTARGTDRMRERYREAEVAARRLRELNESSDAIREAVAKTVAEYNGSPGAPRSFDRLEALIDSQAYRLAFWRVAGDEINYRRFFDINELAAIKVEVPAVFEAVHALPFRLLGEGKVTGLRVDHPDGLFDPPRYFDDLQQGYRKALAAAAQQRVGDSEASHRLGGSDGTGLYVLAEKILAHDETLDPDWPVCGTTGYEFLNQLNGLLIAEEGAAAIRGVYERFTGSHTPFKEILYDGKLSILNYSMSSELHVLAGLLTTIAGRRRESRDFTYGALRQALREVVAAFPVYRTYVRPGDDTVRDEDRRRVQWAVRLSRRRNPELSKAIFDFLASILLLEDPAGLTDEQRDERRSFVLKLQQVTGPVMAKGLEDTSFYRYYPLASLNEVGGEPDADGVSPEQLHRDFVRRVHEEPFALSTTTTHDTKRGEDVRARLNVLSEEPDAWEAALNRWRFLNAPHKTDLDGFAAPDPNETYLIYQTLVGTWEPGLPMPEAYVGRITRYLEKAFREAKLHTSWIDPDANFEQAVRRFTEEILNPDLSGDFIADLDGFVASIADAGYFNGLSQTLIKLTAPGVPDIYQGCDLWDFRLVDPDNRQPVDFETRQARLAQMQAQAETDLAGVAADVLAGWPDPRIKLFLTWRALGLRKSQPDLFLKGEYRPLTVAGPRARHIFAFARAEGDHWALIAVPRLTAAADYDGPGRIAAGWWSGTTVTLPEDGPSRWQSVLTGQSLSTGSAVAATDLFGRFPVALYREC